MVLVSIASECELTSSFQCIALWEAPLLISAVGLPQHASVSSRCSSNCLHCRSMVRACGVGLLMAGGPTSREGSKGGAGAHWPVQPRALHLARRRRCGPFGRQSGVLRAVS